MAEEFPFWDWRRTQQIETSAGDSEQQNSTARVQLATARQQIVILQDSINQANTERAALVSGLATAQSRLTTLETARTQLLARIQSLEDRVALLENPPAPAAAAPIGPQGGNP